MYFKKQVEYNKAKVNSLKSDTLLKKAVQEMAKIDKVATTDSTTLNRCIDNILSKYGIQRPTALERAVVCGLICENTGESYKIKTGFCLKSDEHEKVEETAEVAVENVLNPSVPNFTFCEIGGIAYGLYEKMDFINIIEI